MVEQRRRGRHGRSRSLTKGFKEMGLAEQLRGEIKRSGLSVNRIAKESGIRQQTLQRFASGERDMTLGKADLLCAFFGLKMVKGKRRRA